MAIVRMTAKDGMDVHIETDESADTTLALRSHDAGGKSLPDVPSFAHAIRMPAEAN